jgi:nucleoside phosphorylase
MSPSAPRRNITVQVSNALGAPVTGVDLEVHVGGKLIQTIHKKTEEPARIKIAPPEAPVTIVARIPDVDPKKFPGLAPQRQQLGLSTSRCDFKFMGAGASIVLIVCAKACEETAVRATCDWVSPNTFSRQNDTNIYREGIYLRSDGRIRKVLIVTAGMNNLNANSVTTQALISFPQLKHVLMSGIAGGCPNHEKPPEHVRLGDIVVPDYRGIVQYDHVKATLKKGKEDRKPRSHPQEPSAAMLQAATQLDTGAGLGERPWQAWISKGAQAYQAAVRPPDTSDILHVGAQEVPHPHDPERLEGQPRVHRGAVASADILQKNPKVRDMLRDKWDVRAIEMEGSGVQHAAWAQGKDVMLVRGICDYCDDHKNDVWHPYASLVAAAYTRAMIEVLPDEWFP